MLLRLYLTFLLLLIYNNQNWAKQSNIDSLKTILQSASSDKEKANLNAKIAIDYNAEGNFIDAKPYGLTAYKLAEKLNDFNILGTACNALCNSYCVLGDYKKGMEYALKELTIAEKHHQPKDEVAALLVLNFINEHLGMYNEAQKNLKHALVLAKFYGFDEQLMNCYLAMSSHYSFKKKANQAIAYADSGIRMACKLNLPKKLIEAYGYIATAYTFTEKYDSALRYDTYCLKLIADNNITDKEEIAINYYSIGESYYHLKQFDKAKFFYNKAHNIYIEQNNMEGLRDINLNLSLIDSSENKWKQAYEHYKLQSDYSYRLFNEETANSLENQKKLYETEREEFLNKQENEKIEKEHERKELIQISIIILFILMLTMLLLVLRKRKINPRIVEIIGTFSVLIIFELFTLLTHPIIEKITHHNLILTLFCLVIVASIIVPLHHKVEHWVKHKIGME
jgi:tetratricopeptide (TPR) repeat protein